MLNNQELKQKLLKQAIKAFFTETGINLVVREKTLPNDTVLELEGAEHLQFMVAEKKWLQQTNLGVLVDQIKQLPMKGLLVADYVDPKMAVRLRELDVSFIDTAGNAFFNEKPVYVFIKGNKKNERLDHKVVTGQTYGRVFQPTGLKILYALIRNPELINAPYREIAAITGVALGTVGRVFNDLKNGGYIIEYNKKNRRLKNKKHLLDRWVDGYLEKLRPKLFLGTFFAENDQWWQNDNTDITVYNAKWGGEIAAAKLTGHLKPEKAILYLPEEGGKQLLKDKRLRKDAHGNIQIYRNFSDTDNKSDIVDPIVVYADLLATGDPRNRETARIIYAQELTGLVRED